jgi:hypothetical protein
MVTQRKIRGCSGAGRGRVLGSRAEGSCERSGTAKRLEEAKQADELRRSSLTISRPQLLDSTRPSWALSRSQSIPVWPRYGFCRPLRFAASGRSEGESRNGFLVWQMFGRFWGQGRLVAQDCVLAGFTTHRMSDCPVRLPELPKSRERLVFRVFSWPIGGERLRRQERDGRSLRPGRVRNFVERCR